MPNHGLDVVRAGYFDQLITIQQNADDGGQESDGGPLPFNPTTFAEVWAKVDQLRGRELLASESQTAEQFTYFYIMYIDPKPTEKMRLVWEGDVYDIRFIAHIGASRRVLELTTRKVI